MSYENTGVLTSSAPNIWAFTSTDNISTITASNYIGQDWRSTLAEGELVIMQYPTNIMGIFVVHFVSEDIFLVPNGSFTTTGTSAGNFVTSNSTSTLITYSGISSELNSIVWYGSSTTTTGIATFHPTSDGTVNGTALFTNISSVQAIAANNTTSAIAYPFASLKQVVGGNKTVTINVGVGAALGALGGNTIANAPDGTTVYLTLHGN